MQILSQYHDTLNDLDNAAYYLAFYFQFGLHKSDLSPIR